MVDGVNIGVGNQGALMQHDYRVRQMKVYPIPASELITLSAMNTLAAALFSAAAFCLSFALSIILSRGFATESTPESRLLSHYGIPGCFIAATLFFALGALMWWQRGATVRQIRAECGDVESRGAAFARYATLVVIVVGPVIAMYVGLQATANLR
jgi:hypothetical protein